MICCGTVFACFFACTLFCLCAPRQTGSWSCNDNFFIRCVSCWLSRQTPMPSFELFFSLVPDGHRPPLEEHVFLFLSLLTCGGLLGRDSTEF